MKCVVIAAGLAACLLIPSARAEDSLYKQLGGYDGIAAVTDSLLPKLAGHPSLGRFFMGHSAGSGMKIRQLIVDFICAKSGGPCLYTGRSMTDAHTGLTITEQDWTDALALSGTSMTELKVDPAVQTKVVDFFGTLKGEIVGH